MSILTLRFNNLTWRKYSEKGFDLHCTICGNGMLDLSDIVNSFNARPYKVIVGRTVFHPWNWKNVRNLGDLLSYIFMCENCKKIYLLLIKWRGKVEDEGTKYSSIPLSDEQAIALFVWRNHWKIKELYLRAYLPRGEV